MRHGLTLGELGLWFVKTLRLDVEYRIIEMQVGSRCCAGIVGDWERPWRHRQSPPPGAAPGCQPGISMMRYSTSS